MERITAPGNAAVMPREFSAGDSARASAKQRHLLQSRLRPDDDNGTNEDAPQQRPA